MGGLNGCRGGGGRLSLVVLVSEKPNLVREKSGKFIYLWCWQPCKCIKYNVGIKIVGGFLNLHHFLET